MDKIRYPDPVNLNDYKKTIDSPKVFYGLPAKLSYCKKCVISNQRPNSAVEFEHTQSSQKTTINFDKNGICDACNFAEKKKNAIDWVEREKQLQDL